MVARAIRLAVCISVLLHTAAFLLGQSTSVPGLRVLEVKYTPPDLMGKAELVNDGASTIAAYGLLVTTTLADGREFPSRLSSDATRLASLTSLLSKTPGITITSDGQKYLAGQHFIEQVFATTSGTQSKPVSLRCDVRYVIFVDGTAAGDPEGIRSQRVDWKKEVMTIQKWLPELMKLGEAPTLTFGEFQKFWQRMSEDPVRAGLFGTWGTPPAKPSPFDSMPLPPENLRKLLAIYHASFEEREALLKKLAEVQP